MAAFTVSMSGPTVDSKWSNSMDAFLIQVFTPHLLLLHILSSVSKYTVTVATPPQCFFSLSSPISLSKHFSPW